MDTSDDRINDELGALAKQISETNKLDDSDPIGSSAGGSASAGNEAFTGRVHFLLL